jgi:hypothetical protein
MTINSSRKREKRERARETREIETETEKGSMVHLSPLSGSTRRATQSQWKQRKTSAKIDREVK